MAFVNEEDPQTGKKVTIDRERGAFLRGGGGRWYERTPGGYFTLVWKGRDIVFSYYEELDVQDWEANIGTITYKIATCEYPEELRPYRNDIIEMIHEALDVFGVDFGKQPGVKVKVTIDPRIGGLNPNYDFESQTTGDSPASLPSKKEINLN